MERPRTRIDTMLGARKPAVAVRLSGLGDDGTVGCEVFAEKPVPGPDTARPGVAWRVAAAIGRVFRLGAARLAPEELASLFCRRTPQPDIRWTLLVRLAAREEGDEGKLRDQFAAFPDGTAFSMRLLLTSGQGGARSGGEREACPAAGLPFNRLPDVARLAPLLGVLRMLHAGQPLTPKELAARVEAQARRLGLPVEGLTGKDVTDRLFGKIRKNGGGAWLPEVANSGRGRRRRQAPEESSDAGR